MPPVFQWAAEKIRQDPFWLEVFLAVAAFTWSSGLIYTAPLHLIIEVTSNDFYSVVTLHHRQVIASSGLLLALTTSLGTWSHIRLLRLSSAFLLMILWIGLTYGLLKVLQWNVTSGVRLYMTIAGAEMILCSYHVFFGLEDLRASSRVQGFLARFRRGRTNANYSQ